MVDPVAIAHGTSIFNGIMHDVNLNLTGTKSFKSAAVALTNQPLVRLARERS